MNSNYSGSGILNFSKKKDLRVFIQIYQEIEMEVETGKNQKKEQKAILKRR